VVQVKVPWAEPHGRFTLLMQRFVIDVLQACQTVKGACTPVGISWNQAWHVLERAVVRGLARKQATAVARIGVDEKAFRKDHWYLMIVNDVDHGTVEFVAEVREKASLAAFYESRTPEQLAGIEAVTNAVAEDLNSKIMAIKRRAGGYCNVGNFKNVIYFYCGGLRLFP